MNTTFILLLLVLLLVLLVQVQPSRQARRARRRQARRAAVATWTKEETLAFEQEKIEKGETWKTCLKSGLSVFFLLSVAAIVWPSLM
jgi:hypothetical protein